MTREEEKELIIKNAFEFLKRQDLIMENDIMTYPFLNEENLKEYEVYKMYLVKTNFGSETRLYIKYKSKRNSLLVIHLDDNKELTNLFTETYNWLNAQQKQAEQPQDDYYTRKHDKGKPKLLQVPVEAIQAISEIMDYGSNKYGVGSWDKVEVERYMQAAARHLYACQNDINSRDEESGHKHIKHALCNMAYVVALIEREENKNK